MKTSVRVKKKCSRMKETRANVAAVVLPTAVFMLSNSRPVKVHGGFTVCGFVEVVI